MNSDAENGGGMYLQVNPKLYLLKMSDTGQYQDIMIFSVIKPAMEELCVWLMTLTLDFAHPALNVSSKHLHFTKDHIYLLTLKTFTSLGTLLLSMGQTCFGVLDRCVQVHLLKCT